MKLLSQIILPGILLVLIDYIYLNAISSFFNKQIFNIQKSPIKLLSKYKSKIFPESILPCRYEYSILKSEFFKKLVTKKFMGTKNNEPNDIKKAIKIVSKILPIKVNA